MASNKKTVLPLPPHYNPKTVSDWNFTPNEGQLLPAALDWRRQHGIKPSASQPSNVHLLLIDVQRDFCFPQGTLYVGGRSGTGAIDDTRRIAEFMYRNLGVISNITTTLDTHFLYQIFFPSFWVDRDGKQANPFTAISAEQLRSGEFKPNPLMASLLTNGNYTWLLQQAKHYCTELEKAGKYQLYLWPFHCLLGSTGHTLVGTIQEARAFHNLVRGVQSNSEIKGGHPLTENYSVLRPEVLTRHDGAPLAQKNAGFIRTLLTSDAVIIAGQAASHCVKSSIDDLLDEILAQDPSLAKKVFILRDCMSSVTVPDGKGGFVVDYTPQAEAAFQRFADAGMNLVKSTDPVEDWAGIKL